jgi:PhnB protein
MTILYPNKIMKAYKPEGYNSVSPYFIVTGAQKFTDFLKQVFDAVEKRRYDNKDGTVMHLEVQIDDSIIMLADSSDQWPPTTHVMHVYVEDSDKTFDLAVELGCQVLERPTNKSGDPDKRGTFKDAWGNLWSVSTQLP